MCVCFWVLLSHSCCVGLLLGTTKSILIRFQTARHRIMRHSRKFSAKSKRLRRLRFVISTQEEVLLSFCVCFIFFFIFGFSSALCTIATGPPTSVGFVSSSTKRTAFICSIRFAIFRWKWNSDSVEFSIWRPLSVPAQELFGVYELQYQFALLPSSSCS